MKYKESISILVLIIAVLSLSASVYGIFSSGGSGPDEFTSIQGETVPLYGKGLYRNDSVSVASQGIAQDIVTILLAVPLLLISLYLARRGLLKGRLLLTGTLGYFLYTYTSYSFVWMYNSFFLIYVLLMSASFFAFVMCMMTFTPEELGSCFSPRLPVRFVGGFLIFFAIMIALMWVGRIVPPLLNGTVPLGLEHYSTLVIQALDLGFVAPAAILSGILVIKRRPFGYLLASVITVKGITMGTALTAMIIGQVIAGVRISAAEMLMFPIFNIVVIFCLYLIMKNMKEVGHKAGRAV